MMVVTTTYLKNYIYFIPRAKRHTRQSILDVGEEFCNNGSIASPYTCTKISSLGVSLSDAAWWGIFDSSGKFL